MLILSSKPTIMKKNISTITLLFAITSLFIVLCLPFHSCEPVDEDIPDTFNTDTTIIGVYKPNIYIYPEKTIFLKVNISFPKGGSIFKSIPIYNNGWNVQVDPSGRIDNAYDYLFYESYQPDEWQYKTGWSIERDSLQSFFQYNMSVYGFSINEIKDFIDYWIPRLNTYNYFLIYPQEKKLIENLIQIKFSHTPLNIQRLFYAIKGTNNFVKIDAHKIENKFQRDGFHVTEWGVILK